MKVVKRGSSFLTAAETCFAYKYVTTPVDTQDAVRNGTVHVSTRRVIDYAYDCSVGYVTG